jgi:murein hydrolase activator
MTVIVSPVFFARVLRIAAVLLLLLPALSPSPVVAVPKNREILKIIKERATVEQKLLGLKRQLQEYQKKLKLTAHKESQSFSVLENIRTQILVLEKMISENQVYLKKLDGDIDRLHDEFQGNRQIYGRVSDDFRRTAVSAYKYGGNREIEHFFAAGSVSKALRRAQYMGFFTRAVRSNVNDLQQVAIKLENNRLALEQSYRQKADILKQQERQLKSWSASKKEKEVLLDRLKKNKQEYLVQLASVQKKRTFLQSRIESLILYEQRVLEAERERRRKNLEAKRLMTQRLEAKRLMTQRLRAKRLKDERLEAERLEAKRLKAERPETERLQAERPETQRPRMKKKTLRRKELPVAAKQEEEQTHKTPEQSPEKVRVAAPANLDSPELEKVSADFDIVSRSLPWPVRNGVVAHKFGAVEDKDLKIVTTNNGIDISVPANTQVRAVSGGKVVQIAFLPTFGNIVIIRHPKSYMTVYANLGQLNVVKDDLVKSQQLLGASGKLPGGNSVVHFEIWKGRRKQNPINWLR